MFHAVDIQEAPTPCPCDGETPSVRVLGYLDGRAVTDARAHIVRVACPTNGLPSRPTEQEAAVEGVRHSPLAITDAVRVCREHPEHELSAGAEGCDEGEPPAKIWHEWAERRGTDAGRGGAIISDRVIFGRWPCGWEGMV